ncbi:MAG: universal stress protein [SAR202 cluster bacterium]|nr:universal stress protein [SAR202 cluster bacterium]
MFTKVLVPLDGTEVSTGILPYISLLARGLKMEMVLLSVVNPAMVEELEEFGTKAPMREALSGVSLKTPKTAGERTPKRRAEGPFFSQELENAEFRVKGWLTGISDGMRQSGLQVEYVTKIGQAANTILATARELGCDVIAMSTHGRNAIGRGMLGSVADKVIRSSTVPVLAISPERAAKYGTPGRPMTTLLAPLDGGPLSEKTLPYIITLGKQLRVKVHVVRVVDTTVPITGWWADPRFFEVVQEIRNEAQGYVQEIADRLRTQGLQAEANVLNGNPAGMLVDMARNTPQDLIVIATRGRTGLSRFILGSVTEALVRSSGDPVLIIPTGD